MTDARLPGRWLTDPDLEALSDRAWRIHTGALMWSAEQGTDGRILRRTMRLLHPEGGTAEDARPLIDAGLWEAQGEDFQILNWSPTQTLAATIERARDNNRRNQANWRERQRNQSPGISDDISAYSVGEERRGKDSSPAPLPNPPSPLAPESGHRPQRSRVGAPPLQAEDEARGSDPEISPVSEFEAWYAAYPVDRNKPAARKEWAKTRADHPADLLARTKQFARSVQGRDFVTHPATWLRERRWAEIKVTGPSPEYLAWLQTSEGIEFMRRKDPDYQPEESDAIPESEPQPERPPAPGWVAQILQDDERRKEAS